MITIANANALHIPLPDQSVQCIVTSPPYYGLRDYGTAKWEGGSAECDHSPADTPTRRGLASSMLGGGKETIGHQQEGYSAVCSRCGARRIDAQIGLESTPAAYVASIVAVMRECWRVLKDDGVMWLNLGDSYASGEIGRHDSVQANSGNGWTGTRKMKERQQLKIDTGLKPKDLCGIPWRVAFALQDDGWYLRQDIIWHKPNPMPESVTDRCTKAHEYVFLLTKQARYHYDAEAIQEEAAYDGRKDEIFKGSIKNYDGTMPNGQPQTFAQSGHARWNKDENGNRVKNKRSVWTVATSPYSGAKGLADYVGDDGKPYKASPDCPIHGHLARERTSYTVGYDARPDQNQSRNAGNGNGHEQAPASLQSATTSRNGQDERGGNSQMQNPESIDGCRSEASRPEHTLPVQTVDRTNHTLEPDAPSDRKSDLKPREYDPSAIFHSKRKSKTARVRQTSQHDTASAETHGHTQSTLFSASSIDHDGHNQENKTSGDCVEDERKIDPSAEMSYRNADIDNPFDTSRMSLYCICEVVSTDHFATFPPKLIEPMILAGSRRGDVVLDPFAGSGTTGAVAVKHGRRAVLLDLNTKYIDLQFERTNGVQMTLPQ